jgi:serine/threonine protein kinase
MLTPGHTLQGRYRVIHAIGGGGQGTVYLAKDSRLAGRHWAIKEMSLAQVPAQDHNWAINAFKQQARILAGLKHPSIAAITDFFSEHGNWYLVMEFVEGQALDAVLAASPGQRLPPPQALNILDQLCAVLEYLHAQSPPVIFRDLKPGNVMLTPEDKIQLIDFGIARFFKPSQGQDTVNLGTPGYAAPEQYGSQGQSDVRTDVYGLGVLLHRMLTGHDPTSTPFRLPPAESLNQDVSPQVGQAIRQATAHDPDQRFPSVAGFRAALKGPTTELPLQPQPPSDKTVPRWLIAAAGAGAVIMLLIAFFLFKSSSPTTPAARATHTKQDTAHTSPGAVTVVVTATPGEPTSTPKPPPTPVPATATPSLAQRETALLTTLRYHRDNAPAVFAYQVTTPPQIDGRLNEWSGNLYDVSYEVFDPAGSRSGHADLSGRFYVGWDADNLYLGVEVTDDVHVQIESGELMYQGDDVEIQLDADWSDFNDTSLNSDDYQIGFSAGDFAALQPQAYLWRTSGQEGPGDVIALAALKTASGYMLEAAIPWWTLGGRPPVETALGSCLCLSDNDVPGTAQQQALVSTAALRQWSDPTTWGTLILVNWK